MLFESNALKSIKPTYSILMHFSVYLQFGFACCNQPKGLLIKKHNTMKSKQFYEVPEAELLEVMLERHFLESQQNDSDIETATVNNSYNNSDVWGWMNTD